MAEGPAPGDSFREEWLAWPAEIFLADSRPQEPTIAIEVWAGEEPMVIETVAGAVRARPGRAEHADAVVRGTPHQVLALLSGELDLAAARERGLEFAGAEGALERVRPKHAAPALAER